MNRIVFIAQQLKKKSNIIDPAFIQDEKTSNVILSRAYLCDSTLLKDRHSTQPLKKRKKFYNTKATISSRMTLIYD